MTYKPNLLSPKVPSVWSVEIEGSVINGKPLDIPGVPSVWLVEIDDSVINEKSLVILAVVRSTIQRFILKSLLRHTFFQSADWKVREKSNS